MSFRTLGAGLLLALALPLVTHAATLQELQAQLAQLMVQLSALQSQQSTPTAPQSDAAAASCPNLSRNLGRGMKGADVTQLQNFLIAQGQLTAGNNTGFFGSLTEAAVKQFQCKHLQICSGSASSNGYGAVGPRTRFALLRCITPVQSSASAPAVTPPISTSSQGNSTTPNAPQTPSTPIMPIPSIPITLPSPTLPQVSTSCAPLAPQMQTLSCPTGQTGSISQTRTSLCMVGHTSPLWGSWTTNANTCATPAISETIGGYFWGGYMGSNALVEGARKLSQSGLGSIVRVVATPRMRSGGSENIYNFDLQSLSSECPTLQAFLPCVIRTKPYQDLFALPGFSIFVITAYDSISAGADGWRSDFVNPNFFTSDTRARVVAEYRDMTLTIFETQRGTGKTFVISNWEADNAIYCGSAYDYATSESFRTTCNAQTPTPSQKIAGMKTWFELRKQGIEEGRSLAAQRGWSGITVSDAIQFTSYLALKNAGYQSAFHDIIPSVRPVYADYSAWESIQGGTMDEDLHYINQAIAAHGSKLIIGELGFLNMHTEPATWRWIETVKAALRAKPAFSTLWEAYPTTDYNDAFLNADGSWTAAFSALRTYFMNAEQDTSVRVWGANDSGVLTQGRRHIDLYGTFPGSGHSVNMVCDGASVIATADYVSEGQINISTPDLNQERWCSFRVSSNTGTSASYGPRRICAGGPCAPFR